MKPPCPENMLGSRSSTSTSLITDVRQALLLYVKDDDQIKLRNGYSFVGERKRAAQENMVREAEQLGFGYFC